MAEIKGRFKKGNTIGFDTRVKAGETSPANKYKDEYCEAIIAYFAEPKSEILYKRSFYKDGTLKSEEPIILPPKYPTFELFAASIGVVNNTLLNWCKRYPQFSNAYAIAKNLQLGIAKQNGVAKTYDSNFTKFLLVNDHGYTDKAQIESHNENINFNTGDLDLIEKLYKRLEAADENGGEDVED